jgi:enoyl-CoA hydratase/carnithine racemase
MNAIGELCAQFRRGILAVIRELGAEGARDLVAQYHRLHPEAAKSAWHPEVFETIQDAAWQQLYVNAEHDGATAVITLSRESYNSDVDAELNRAIDWLKQAGVERVIVSGDFHLSTQLVGADTSEFFPALEQTEEGTRIAGSWSRTARRLNDEFKVSVGFVGGKRCLGGMLELLMHCHYLVAVEGAGLGMPEVTLPVVPGMEGCHWPFRKAKKKDWPKLLGMLLSGETVPAGKAVGWLIDFAGPVDDAIKTAWKIATEADSGLGRRKLEAGVLKDLPEDVPGLAEADGPSTAAARKAIADNVRESCGVPLAEALGLQAKHSAAFMVTKPCKKGRVGAEAARTMVS